MEVLPITISNANLAAALEQFILHPMKVLQPNQQVFNVEFVKSVGDQISLNLKIRKEQEGRLIIHSAKKE